jgi:MoaA/NifB/PqqE/SkfB family radical SAM enzyme
MVPRKMFRVYEKMRYGLHFEQTVWTEFPRSIQIDTNNHCGKKYCGVQCEYCKPQRDIASGKRRYNEMPMEHIQWVIDEIGRDGAKLRVLNLFLNGDLSTEPRLPEIIRYSKQVNPHLPLKSFTNGVLPEVVSLAANKELDLVCFTISAHTPELYKKVHGGDHFCDAVKHLKMVAERRKGRVEVHCVVTKNNYAYLDGWWEYFTQLKQEYPNVTLVLSPLVASNSNLPSEIAAQTLKQEEVEHRIQEVAGAKGVMWNTTTLPYPEPCVLWHNSSFSSYKGGTALQCCNWADEDQWNYGTIADFIKTGKSLKEYWFERLFNRQNNPLCQSCNMRHTDYKMRLEQMRFTCSLKN